MKKMKTMKLIDLYNKIAEGEEPPKKIIFKNELYILKKWENIEETDYCCESTGDLLGDIYLTSLNEEVQIIEDTPKEDKKIEKLDVVLLGQCDNWLQPTIDTDEKIRAELNPYIIDVIKENTLVMQRKINEIIDKVNNE